MTMLEATSEANNRSALSLALEQYKQSMDATITPKDAPPTFLKEKDLQVPNAYLTLTFIQFTNKQ